MPVIDDSDEPPAKCCKYCEESTHGVDGPVSWRLTLDQDLIDTLKGSFPNWFQPQGANSSLSKTITTEAVVNNHNKAINSGSHNISTVATATDNNNNSKAVTTANDNGNSIIITATAGLQNGLSLLNNTICVTPISIDARAPYLHAQQQQQHQQHNLLGNGIKGKNNNNNTIHLHQLNGAAVKSAALSHAIPLLTATGLSPNPSASPASSVTSNGSAKSHSTISSNSSPLQPINLSNGKLSVKTNLIANEYNSSSPTSSSSCSSSSSSSSTSPTTSSRSSISAKLSKADFSTKTHAKTYKNLNSHTTKLPAVTASLAGPQVTRAGALERFTGGDHSGLHQPIASVGATTITRVIPKSPSVHSLSGGSLLATFSSPGSAATFEIISDSSCTGLLTSAHLSGKSAFEHSFHDIILLQEAYDDMSEGEQRLNASFLGGSSDDGTNSDFYDPRQSPPKAIVDSSPALRSCINSAVYPHPALSIAVHTNKPSQKELNVYISFRSVRHLQMLSRKKYKLAFRSRLSCHIVIRH